MPAVLSRVAAPAGARYAAQGGAGDDIDLESALADRKLRRLRAAIAVRRQKIDPRHLDRPSLSYLETTHSPASKSGIRRGEIRRGEGMGPGPDSRPRFSPFVTVVSTQMRTDYIFIVIT